MVNRVCVSDEPDVVIAQCSSDSDCLPLSVCIAGKCDKECTKNDNCPEGLECVLYRCVGDAGVVEEVRGRDVVEQPDSAEDTLPEDTLPEDTLPEDTLPEGCDPADGPYGAACSCEQECASSLCIFNTLTDMGMCTQYCQTAAQCPGPDICIAMDKASVCITNDSGRTTSCDPDLAFCYSSDYMQNKLGQCVCTTKCSKSVDCPEGFACHLAGALKYCVSTGEACSADYNPCFGQCAGDPAAGVGFCTGICISSSDCPSGWTCQPIGGGISICASPF